MTNDDKCAILGNDFVSEVINRLSTHYIFNKIKDIKLFNDGIYLHRGIIKFKMEMLIEFNTKNENDISFFLSRLYSNTKDIQDRFYRHHLHITHMVSYEDKHKGTELVSTSFKEYKRNITIGKILEDV